MAVEEDVPLHDGRAIEHQLSSSKTGLAVLDMESALAYGDCTDCNKSRNATSARSS